MRKPLWFAIMVIVAVISWGVPSQGGEAGDAKELTIAGAGPSTKVVELLAKEFCAANPGFSISVPPISIKHKGGMEWVASKGMLFGRTGRPMSEQDKTEFGMLAELPIARIKVSFAVSKDLGVAKLYPGPAEGYLHRAYQQLEGSGRPGSRGHAPGPAERRICFRGAHQASTLHGRIEICKNLR